MITFENRDCIEGLKELPPESVDLLVTDPPYRIISGGDSKDQFSFKQMSGAISHNSKLTKQGKIFRYNEIRFSEWLPECYRVLKPNTHAYIMVNSRNLKDLWEEAEKAGFIYQNLLVWDKGNALPNKFYMNAYELILMLRKGKQRWINHMGDRNLISIPNVRNKLHPTEKPVELMRLLIENSTGGGQTVLDPFVGSGSTIIACQESGRDFIGYEVDEEFYRIAQDRIAETTAQIRMDI